MGASKTEIANQALIKLGQPRVSNIETDTSVAAQTMNGIWQTVLTTTLQTFPWNFAIKRTDLAASAVLPSWGWDNQFPLPSDCLQILEVKDDPDYVIEEGYIRCDQTGPLYIRYIAYISETSLYPPVFIDLFTHDLALAACERITNDRGLQQVLLSERRGIAERALITDSVENWPEKPIEDAWITARA